MLLQPAFRTYKSIHNDNVSLIIKLANIVKNTKN